MTRYIQLSIMPLIFFFFLIFLIFYALHPILLIFNFIWDVLKNGPL